MLFSPISLLGVNDLKSKFSIGLSDALSGMACSKESYKIVLSLMVTVVVDILAMAPIIPISIKKKKICTMTIPTIVANVYFKKLLILFFLKINLICAAICFLQMYTYNFATANLKLGLFCSRLFF